MCMVETVLRHYPAECQPSGVEPLGTAGGMSGARFWRLAAPRRTLLLRRWPSEHPSAERLRFIHAVLRHAEQAGMRVLPVPLPALDQATFVAQAGHLWELTPWLPGTADYQHAPRAARLRGAMSALAEFHRAVADFEPVAAGASPAVAERFARLRQLESGGIELWAAAISAAPWPEIVPVARRVVATFEQVAPAARGQLAPLVEARFLLQPCIRDVWHDNVLFVGDRVTGLVDFGVMQFDTPAVDVARLLGSLAGDDPRGRRAGLDAYGAIRPLDDSERLAVAALDQAGMVLAGCNWIRWLFVEGRQFDDRAQVARRLGQIADRLEGMAKSPPR